MKPFSLRNLSAVSNYLVKDIIVISVVEPEDKLVEIGLEVLRGDAVVDTDVSRG